MRVGRLPQDIDSLLPSFLGLACPLPSPSPSSLSTPPRETVSMCQSMCPSINAITITLSRSLCHHSLIAYNDEGLQGVHVASVELHLRAELVVRYEIMRLCCSRKKNFFRSPRICPRCRKPHLGAGSAISSNESLLGLQAHALAHEPGRRGVRISATAASACASLSEKTFRAIDACFM